MIALFYIILVVAGSAGILPALVSGIDIPYLLPYPAFPSQIQVKSGEEYYESVCGR